MNYQLIKEFVQTAKTVQAMIRRYYRQLFSFGATNDLN